jgi:hypothetical protein
MVVPRYEEVYQIRQARQVGGPLSKEQRKARSQRTKNKPGQKAKMNRNTGELNGLRRKG